MTNRSNPSENSCAIWISTDTIAVPLNLSGETRAGAKLRRYHLENHGDVYLRPTDLNPDEANADRRVENGYIALRLQTAPIGDPDARPVSVEKVRELLRGPLVVQVAQPGVGTSPGALMETSVQIGPVLDEVYAAAKDDPVGPHWEEGVPTLSLWAPTATRVSLLLWGDPEADPKRMDATLNEATGIWSVLGESSWRDRQYLWEVNVYTPALGAAVTNQVTDPYSTGLTVDSVRSVLVDLKDPEWKPEGWGQGIPPALRTQAAQSLYELHVRDFSIWDQSVPPNLRGTYSAFTLENSEGVRHLRSLAEAGLTSVHLLPTYDIASNSIPEDRATQKIPAVDGIDLTPENEKKLERLPGWSPSGESQQAAVADVIDQDGFNWGYDPLHWGAPEGSYASNGNQVGGRRTLEFRRMVRALHKMDLRVVQDVVYNHTMEHGSHDQSVLDRVVPGYYHRLDACGKVESSTCCSNVATERMMAEKLMVDTLVTWAKDYHVDGFRFDLMGHHSLENMVAVRAALDGLTVAEDGVDGSAIYLYGEGWDFGEVAGDALFTQATQGNLAGTGIGAFNDRLRDAVRGGGPTDFDHRFEQGFASGLLTDPNPIASSHYTEEQSEYKAKRYALLIMLGLVGSLADYRLNTPEGNLLGKDLDYSGQKAGFAKEPQECVNYVEAHDNESLYDSNVFKLPEGAPMAVRARLQVLANATVILGQAPAFLAAGTEILRSKSLDRDSYNSGDWFNAIDWSANRNTFGSGLPMAFKNQSKWHVMAPLLENPTLKPDRNHMVEAREMILDLLRVRSSTALLTLGSAAAIQQKVTFPLGHLTTPGVILMAVDDSDDPVDPNYRGAIVVFNASGETWEGQVEGWEGRRLALHPALESGSDPAVKHTAWHSETGKVQVPPRTAAVLVEKRTVKNVG